MDLWAVRDTHRFGISVPDEDPPGNQVTPRVEVTASLIACSSLPACSHPGASPVSWSRQGLPLCGVRHAPSCYILVTQRAPDGWDSPRFLELILNLGSFPFPNFFSPAAGTDYCSCQVLR
jgi:hypothetical protein